MLTEEQKAGLMPGVKELVIFLNENGFPTVDSGDGTGENEDSCSFPMIAFDTSNMGVHGCIEFSKRLSCVLQHMGVEFDSRDTEGPAIQFSYDPADDSCAVVLYNVLSEDADMGVSDE